jgi:hypothetical protein
MRLNAVRIGGVLLALAGSSLAAEGSEPAEARGRVLYFSQVVGGGHGTIPMGRAVLRKLGREDGGFEVEECRDCRKWSAEYFERYAAVVSFGYGKLPLTEGNRQALLGFIRGGGGFVGIHAAVQMRPHRPWPAYAKMLGAVRGGGGWHEKVRVTVEDRFHPATRHLDLSFVLNDEIYQFGQWDRERTHVLLSVDVRSVNLFARGVKRMKDPDVPVSWCHPYGEGRVFYTVLGHEAGTWQSRPFQKHVLGGVLWAMGSAEATVRLGTDGRIHEVRGPRAPDADVALACP